MTLIFISGFLGALIANIANIFIIKQNIVSLIDIFKISLFILPLQYLIAVFYTYYYNNGYVNNFSYPSLLIISYSIGILLSFFIQYFLLKKHINWYELSGIIIISLGIIIVIYGKTIK